jgi:hypothetical protein
MRRQSVSFFGRRKAWAGVWRRGGVSEQHSDDFAVGIEADNPDGASTAAVDAEFGGRHATGAELGGAGGQVTAIEGEHG